MTCNWFTRNYKNVLVHYILTKSRRVHKKNNNAYEKN